MVSRLVFVRHAESTFSARSLGNGDPDVDCPLTEAGRGQAERLRARLGPLDVCVTTAFARTIETADIALAGRSVARVIEAGLNDPALGVYESRPLAEFLAWLRAHDWTARPDGGGESQVDVVTRYVAAFERLLARSEDRVLVVTHNLPMAVAQVLAHEPPPAVRREYTARFEYAVPVEIAPEALGRGIARARRELAELETG